MGTTSIVVRARGVLVAAAALVVNQAAPVYAEEAPGPKPKPCSDGEYRQFDFWIGDWTVTDAKGTVVGRNRITPILDGCALSEDWTGAKGTRGVSTNVYDKKRKRWHQTWVDSRGGTLYLDGEWRKGRMELVSAQPPKEKAGAVHRIRWTPLKDGRVKQHWQTSKDRGKTWSDAFVGFYKKNA